MDAPRLLLASGSPRRRELLEAAGIPFDVGPAPDVDESVPPGLSPGEAVATLALRKVRAVIDGARDRVVMTADTLVFLDGEPLGKPADAADAERMLGALSGRTHRVLTGVALAGPAGDAVRTIVGHEATGVRFRPLSPAEIEAYVATGEPLDKAGGYAIQGGAAGFVESLDGPEDNVIGLPVELLRGLLAELLRPEGGGRR